MPIFILLTVKVRVASSPIVTLVGIGSLIITVVETAKIGLVKIKKNKRIKKTTNYFNKLLI